MDNLDKTEKALFDELADLIEKSQRQLVSQANHILTVLFWRIGKRINEEILQRKRAEYAKQIVSTVSTQLKAKYGRNFELRNLRRMLQFAEQFTDEEIVVTLSRQLSWSHFVELLPVKNNDAKLFYAKVAATQALGVRDLRKRIAAKEFERTSIANLQNTSNHPAIHNNFKDPYFPAKTGKVKVVIENEYECTFTHRGDRSHILRLGKDAAAELGLKAGGSVRFIVVGDNVFKLEHA